MIDTKKMIIVRSAFKLIPTSRCHKFKAVLLRWAGVKVGNNVRICSSAKILGNGCLTIGDNTWIGHEALIICSSSIIIGSNVDIAPRVFIGTGTHEIDMNTVGIAGKGINKDIVIEDGCWLGAGSIILPGVVMGEKTVVAAGAVVNKSIDSYILVGGVPARIIRDLRIEK